jgi:hypothetical protein
MNYEKKVDSLKKQSNVKKKIFFKNYVCFLLIPFCRDDFVVDNSSLDVFCVCSNFCLRRLASLLRVMYS